MDPWTRDRVVDRALASWGRSRRGRRRAVIGLMLWTFVTALALFFGLAVAAQLEAERAGVPEPGVETPRETLTQDPPG
jgi:hypothetical protein